MTIIRKNGLLFLFIIALSFKSHLIGQNKIGLCLSGGGAKGLAHIGVLKLIDSLGIKIDYITGTSMGGVIGALYACGYTGKQIDSLAKNLDWNSVLNQNVPLNEIYSDEKDEFGKYIGEIPIRNRKLFITGIIEGQGLLNLFNRLTRHVNAISDFSKFPIPFKCMAVDIITAKQVILDHGNLAIAMRATMSIPTIFKPVKIDNMLLIDGGLMNNFPVQELKKMGADIIIGSYTGGRLMNEKEMNTVNKLLIQTSSFYGIQESRDDMEACAIFNNLNSILGYKAGDFEKSKKIIKAGANFAYQVLPKLIELADAQKNNHIIYKKEPLIQSNAKIKINSIYVDFASQSKRKKNNLRLETFIKDRISLNTKDSVKFKTIERSIKRLYGTRNFFKAYYTLTPLADGSYDFTTKVEPDVKFRFKGALHFDTEIGTGAILNVTARNWLGKNSRLVGTLDLAQSPEYRIHYRKYFRHSNFSFNVNFLRTKVVQPMVFDSEGNAIRDYAVLYRNFGFGLNCNFGIPSSLYIGFIGEINNYQSKYANTDVSEKGLSNVNHLQNLNFGLHTQYKYSTTNRVVFPKKGVDLFIENKVLISTGDLNYNRLNYDSLIKSTVIINESLESFGASDKLFFRLIGLIPFNKKISMFSTVTSGLIFKYTNESSDTDSAYVTENIRGDGYFVGGAEQRARPNQVPLIGLKEGQLNSTDGFITLQLGVQFEVYPKLVISPMFNYCYAANSPKELFKNMPKIDFNNLSKMINETYWNTYTYGINIGYRSLFGPISVNMSKAAIYNKWQVYFTVGYKF